MFLLHSVLLLWCMQLAQGEAQPGDAKEQEKLEGTWTFVKSSAENNQKQDNGAKVRVVFKGDTISFVAEGNKRSVQGTYTVDPSKNPKTMDITVDSNGAKVLTQAIFELDNDTLKLCHYLGGMASKDRPKEFVADKQTVLGILRREKK